LHYSEAPRFSGTSFSTSLLRRLEFSLTPPLDSQSHRCTYYHILVYLIGIQVVPQRSSPYVNVTSESTDQRTLSKQSVSAYGAVFDQLPAVSISWRHTTYILPPPPTPQKSSW
jgi:hypothetical protein